MHGCTGTSLPCKSPATHLSPHPSGAASFRPFILLGLWVFPHSPGGTVFICGGTYKKNRLCVNAQLTCQNFVSFEIILYSPTRLLRIFNSNLMIILQSSSERVVSI